ncbi:MAG: hypothetical protein OXC62_09230 [Aestuariivita sp.]|nr:hypothetical protein [Aestuariivita sp.]
MTQDTLVSRKVNSMSNTEKIIEGTTIGVVAGVIVSLAGWLSNELLDERRQQEQLDHMRSLVAEWRTDFYTQPDPHPIASPERIRVLIFKEMEAQLQNALERRSTHVPYDRLYEIERVFSDIKKFERYGPTTNEGISCDGPGTSEVNIKIYEDAYRKLEKEFGLPELATQHPESASTHKVQCATPDPVQVIVLERLH